MKTDCRVMRKRQPTHHEFRRQAAGARQSIIETHRPAAGLTSTRSATVLCFDIRCRICACRMPAREDKPALTPTAKLPSYVSQ
jgi:hypothetical protein